MIYWDVVIFSPGLQLLIIIINLSFLETFMSSAVAVTLFVMMCCATFLAQVTINKHFLVCKLPVELAYQKPHVSNFLPHENSSLDKSKTVFRPDCLRMKMNNFTGPKKGRRKQIDIGGAEKAAGGLGAL